MAFQLAVTAMNFVLVNAILPKEIPDVLYTLTISYSYRQGVIGFVIARRRQLSP